MTCTQTIYEDRRRQYKAMYKLVRCGGRVYTSSEAVRKGKRGPSKQCHIHDDELDQDIRAARICKLHAERRPQDITHCAFGKVAEGRLARVSQLTQARRPMIAEAFIANSLPTPVSGGY